MSEETHYTNEKLQNKCKNNFELAKFAIKMAKDYMAKGEVKTLSELICELEGLESIDENQASQDTIIA